MNKDPLRRIAGAGMRLALRALSRPYRPPPRGALIVAPHPDDETLGCGGAIAAMAGAGIPVRVVFLTDGAASHRGHPTLAPSELARRRRAEALAALGVLGVGPGSVRFWGLPDGGLDRLSPAEAAEAGERLAAAVAEELPDDVFSPFRAGGSTEHAAATGLVAGALARAGRGRLLEYPVWAWWNPLRLRARLLAPGRNFRHRLPPPLAGLKRRALDCHRSQIEPVPPWPDPALPRWIAAACCGSEEFFFATARPGPQRG